MDLQSFQAQDRTLATRFNVMREGSIKRPRFQRKIACDQEIVVDPLGTVLRELPAGIGLVFFGGSEEPFESRYLIGAPRGGGTAPESHIVPWDLIREAGHFTHGLSRHKIRKDREAFLRERAEIMASRSAERSGKGAVGTSIFGIPLVS